MYLPPPSPPASARTPLYLHTRREMSHRHCSLTTQPLSGPYTSRERSTRTEVLLRLSQSQSLLRPRSLLHLCHQLFPTAGLHGRVRGQRSDWLTRGCALFVVFIYYVPSVPKVNVSAFGLVHKCLSINACTALRVGSGEGSERHPPPSRSTGYG